MLIITNWKALNINIDNDLTHEVKNGRLEDLFNVEDLGLDKEDLKQLKDGIVPQLSLIHILHINAKLLPENAEVEHDPVSAAAGHRSPRDPLL